jgi:D-glycero-D-manno-heptose 1,7-bisphosphate phosphatase
MSRRGVFLDRDGVLNEPIIRNGRPFPPASVQETVLTLNADICLRRLKSLGFLLVVVSNQPDVRRGTTGRDRVEEIHQFLSEQLPLDDFFVCYHDDEDKCNCRKPLPGLIHQAAEKYGIELDGSYMIGDRWRDMDAGAAAGCRTVFIDRGYDERKPDSLSDITVSSLSQAVDWILDQER